MVTTTRTAAFKRNLSPEKEAEFDRLAAELTRALSEYKRGGNPQQSRQI